MTKHTTVLAGLLSHLSGSDFGKAVKNHQADKGVRNLSTFDSLRRVHTQVTAYAGEPWGGTEGMDPESNAL
jgi:hypothetical protein